MLVGLVVRKCHFDVTVCAEARRLAQRAERYLRDLSALWASRTSVKLKLIYYRHGFGAQAGTSNSKARGAFHLDKLQIYNLCTEHKHWNLNHNYLHFIDD